MTTEFAPKELLEANEKCDKIIEFQGITRHMTRSSKHSD